MQAARVKRARVRANVVDADNVIVVEDADDSIRNLALLVSEPFAADSGEVKYRKFLIREWAVWATYG